MRKRRKQWANLRYYADTIVTLNDDYTADIVGRQLAVLKSELNAGGLQGLAPVADIYARHAAQYRAAQVMDRSGWLADCKKAG